MSRNELELAKQRQMTVFGVADRKYQEILKERRETGKVRKYTREQMEAVLHAADEAYLITLAELGIHIPGTKRRLRAAA